MFGYSDQGPKPPKRAPRSHFLTYFWGPGSHCFKPVGACWASHRSPTLLAADPSPRARCSAMRQGRAAAVRPSRFWHGALNGLVVPMPLCQIGIALGYGIWPQFSGSSLRSRGCFRTCSETYLLKPIEGCPYRVSEFQNIQVSSAELLFEAYIARL